MAKVRLLAWARKAETFSKQQDAILDRPPHVQPDDGNDPESSPEVSASPTSLPAIPPFPLVKEEVAEPKQQDAILDLSPHVQSDEGNAASFF